MKMLSITLITLSACVATPAPARSAEVGWPTYNNSYDSQRYSTLKQITRYNVAELKPVCEARLGDAGSFQSGPLVIDNTLYVTTTLSTFALDAATCDIRWQHDYTPERIAFPANRGAAYLDQRVFRGLPDARVIALDAKTGRELWRVKVGDPANGEFVSAAPIAWHGLLFVGMSGGDWGNRGRMLGLSTDDGHEVWRFNVIPQPGEPGFDTWPDEKTARQGGGAIWASYTLDTDAGELFVPTGNPVPMDGPQLRRGDNLYTDSLIVLNARSGQLKWFHQFHHNDADDYDFAAAPMLFKNRQGRRLAAVAGKDGYLYTFDRDTHALLYQVPTTTIRPAAHQPRQEGDRFCPGVFGGNEWNGPAYDPVHRAIFNGATDWCMISTRFPASDKPGEMRLAGGVSQWIDPDAVVSGWITRIDASSGVAKWKYETGAPVVAGITPTAGGLVFGGDIAGNLLALDSESGKLLFKYSSGGSLAGGVVTYAQSGRQYVAFTSGNISRISFVNSTGRPKLVIMGTSAVQEPHIVTARPVGSHVSGIARGREVFSMMCASCHGTQGEGGIGPTLKTASTRLGGDGIKAVLENPRAPMPKFYPETINDNDLLGLVAFLTDIAK